MISPITFSVEKVLALSRKPISGSPLSIYIYNFNTLFLLQRFPFCYRFETDSALAG
jgi:hypothetical protein